MKKNLEAFADKIGWMIRNYDRERYQEILL